nr:trehalase-like [Onthophagus taurus]
MSFFTRLILISFFRTISSHQTWLIWGPDLSPKYDYSTSCDHVIFCQSTQSKTIMFVCAIYCKTGLDPIKYASVRLLDSPKIIREKSDKLIADYYDGRNMEEAVNVFSEFFKNNFAYGGDLEHWTPMDFTTFSRFVTMIFNKNVQAFAITVITMWPSLGWIVPDVVKKEPDRRSMIDLPNGFIGLANDTTEWRYLDSYLILQGVLVSKMFLTAQGILNNMIYLIKNYGFIPSRSRIQYLDRSGPPVFAKMVSLYLNKTNDLNWVRNNIDTVAKEMEYWKQKRFITIKKQGEEYKLAQYKVRSKGLRLENLKGDFEMTEPVKKYREMHGNEFKSADESGWLFSSRWIFNKNRKDGPLDGRKGHPRYTNLSRIIPVDLNALIYGSFDELSKLYAKIGRQTKSLNWRENAENILEAIQQVLWNETDGTWYDYDIDKNEHRAFFYASNLVPLWTRAYQKSSNNEVRANYGAKTVEYLHKEEIDKFDGGIPASTFESNEEWDFPNAWPSSQLMIIDGLRDTNDPEATYLAEQFATKFLQTTFICYRKTKSIVLNYDVTNPGASRYIAKEDRKLVQRYGYATTNAAVLSIIHSFIFPYGTLVRSGDGVLVSKMGYVVLFLIINLMF